MFITFLSRSSSISESFSKMERKVKSFMFQKMLVARDKKKKWTEVGKELTALSSWLVESVLSFTSQGYHGDR